MLDFVYAHAGPTLVGSLLVLAVSGVLLIVFKASEERGADGGDLRLLWSLRLAIVGQALVVQVIACAGIARGIDGWSSEVIVGAIVLGFIDAVFLLVILGVLLNALLARRRVRAEQQRALGKR